jgi:hypothetical protein
MKIERNWSSLIKEDKTNGMFPLLILVWITSWVRYFKFWNEDHNDKRKLFQIMSGLSLRDRDTE